MTNSTNTPKITRAAQRELNKAAKIAKNEAKAIAKAQVRAEKLAKKQAKIVADAEKLAKKSDKALRIEAALWCYNNFVGTIEEIADALGFTAKQLEHITLKEYAGTIADGPYAFVNDEDKAYHSPSHRSQTEANTRKHPVHGYLMKTSFPDVKSLDDIVTYRHNCHLIAADPAYAWKVSKEFMKDTTNFELVPEQYLALMTAKPAGRACHKKKSYGFYLKQREDYFALSERNKVMLAESTANRTPYVETEETRKFLEEKRLHRVAKQKEAIAQMKATMAKKD